jgi:hypothetical protein
LTLNFHQFFKSIYSKETAPFLKRWLGMATRPGGDAHPIKMAPGWALAAEISQQAQDARDSCDACALDQRSDAPPMADFTKADLIEIRDRLRAAGLLLSDDIDKVRPRFSPKEKADLLQVAAYRLEIADKADIQQGHMFDT